MEQTIGEKRVRKSFDPSALSEVDTAKNSVAHLIDAAEAVKARTDDPEVKRLAALAATDLESGCSWPVKALTAGK